ncbi:MAG: UTP--glucose-1-phosphate uridylyltransferase GalU [Pseudomonadota bacterium]
MLKQVKTAVFPVAGRGTRFLPATKASPKEMLPVVDKPLIQYAVEEALAAGVEKLVFVTGSSKRAIEDHFDSNPELERSLESSGKLPLLESVRAIVPKNVTCIYIRQSEPLGLGHAVLCARPVVGGEPFAVHLADDLINSTVPCLSQMAEVFGQRGGSVLGVQTVPKDQTEKYGVVEVEAAGERLGKVHALVEKPKPEDAPSNLAVVGRYILTPRIFDLIEKTASGTGGEIQLTDAIAALLEEQHVFAYRFEGTRYDCGSKLGYLKASVEYGLNHPTLGEDFREYLDSLLGAR